jgi:hypothetical protein
MRIYPHALVVIAAIAGCLAVICLYLWGPGASIEFVLPNGFRGPIWIVEDPNVDNTMEYSNGRYIAQIPRNGVLRLSSTRAFKRLHSMTAKFENGKTLYTDDVGVRHPTLA